MPRIAFPPLSAYKRRMDDLQFKGPVAVAVSGGMDSLYSLLSLKESGVELFALHALFLPPHLRSPGFEGDLERLKESARHLGIKLHLADLSRAFEAQVIKPFIQAYLAGKTPNPCASCNPAMKFGLLAEEARRLGAAHIATGHYVKRLDFAEGPAIFAGDDASKDQSYFLSLTPLASLAGAVFPLARRKKRDIAAELEARGIAVPQNKESQEICFIANDDYRAFLRAEAARLGLRLSGPGPVRLQGGDVLGQHEGLWGYTQGQRHGLGIAWKEPLYVLGKDAPQNTLIVGPRSAFGCQPCLCGPPNFFVEPANWPDTVLAKTRYRQRLAPARAEFFKEGGKAHLALHFLEGDEQAPAAPGQVAAIYMQSEHGLRLLAGAEIGVFGGYSRIT